MAKYVKNVNTEDETLDVGPWKQGVINAKPGKDIPTDGLLDAVNVDLSDDGKPRRRKGSKLVVGVQYKGRSCAADDYGLYFFDGQYLKKETLNNGLWTEEILGGGYDTALPVYWTVGQGSLWFSNGVQRGRIKQGVLLPFSVEQPSDNPVLTAFADGGGFAPGTYGVSVTFITNTGEESGCGQRYSVDVPAAAPVRDGFGLNPIIPSTGKIVLSNIPQPKSSNIAYIRIYVTEANGTVCYKYADIPVGQSIYVMLGIQPKGQVLFNELTDEFPACTLLQVWRGYLLGAQGNVLWFSEPQRFGLTQMQENFMQFAEPITMIAPVDDGFYVVAEKTWFISGGKPSEWGRREVLPYGGAVPGTFVKHPVKSEVSWFSDRGEIFGRVGGQVLNETIQKIAPNKYKTGAAFYRRQDGIEQIVNSFPTSGQQSKILASDFMDAEIIRAKAS